MATKISFRSPEDKRRRNRLALSSTLGLISAALGIGVPIVWDRYKTTSAVEVQLVSSSVVVDTTQGLEQLRVSYRDEAVPRVSKLDLTITNTGRTPIRNEDVVTPLRLAFTDGQILDLRVTSVTPRDLSVTPATAPDRKSVDFRFPLLNPDDGARLSLLLAGTVGNVSLTGRIAGITTLRLIDSTSHTTSVWRRFSKGDWVVLGFTAFAAFILIVGLIVLGQEQQIATEWKAGAISFNTSTPSQYLAALKAYDLKEPELEDVLKFLHTSDPNTPLSDERRAWLTQQIGQGLTKLSSTYMMIGFLAALTLLGSFYLFSRIS